MDQMHKDKLQSLHPGDELFVNERHEVVLRGGAGRADHVLCMIDSEELPDHIAQLRQRHTDISAQAAALQQDWDSNVDRAALLPQILLLQQQLQQPYLGEGRELHADLEAKVQTINQEYAPPLTVNDQAAEAAIDPKDGAAAPTLGLEPQPPQPEDAPLLEDHPKVDLGEDAGAPKADATPDGKTAKMTVLDTSFVPNNAQEIKTENHPDFEDAVAKKLHEEKLDSAASDTVAAQPAAGSRPGEEDATDSEAGATAVIKPAEGPEGHPSMATERKDALAPVEDAPQADGAEEGAKAEKTAEERRAEAEEAAKDQMLNLDKKLELCEKAEALQDSEEWRKTTEALNALMEEWKQIGKVTSFEKNDEVWSRFATARSKFFDRKRAHADEIQVEQEANLLKKQELLAESRELQHSTDWGPTTKRMIALQQEWEAIGRAPRKQNDAIWQEWKASRDVFFQAKKAHFANFKNELDDNYRKKQALTERAEELQDSSDWHGTTDELSHLMEQWKSVGPVPRAKSNEQWDRFNAARRAFFKRKDADRDKRREHYKLKEEGRLGQARLNLHDLEAELKDDEERLAEFKETLDAPMGEGKKDKELREHLLSLVAKLEAGIPRKRQQLELAKADVQQREDGGKKKIKK